MRKPTTFFNMAAVLTGFAAILAPLSAAPVFKIERLPFSVSTASYNCINNSGVLGGSLTPSNGGGATVGFLRAADGSVSLLGGSTVSSPHSYVTVINDAGTYAGYRDSIDGTIDPDNPGSGSSDPTYNSFLAGSNIYLEFLSGMPNPFSPSAINESNTIVGSVLGSDGLRQACIYVNRSLTTLSPESSDSDAADINNVGEVVGSRKVGDPGNEERHSFIYKNAEVTDLQIGSATNTRAIAINDRGHIAGEVLSNFGQGYLYADGKVAYLSSLRSDGQFVHANLVAAMNNQDAIVGATDTDTGRGAYLYSEGKMVDLNKVGVTVSGSAEGFTSLSSAELINDLGQIVGKGEYVDDQGNRQSDWYLLTPLPTSSAPSSTSSQSPRITSSQKKKIVSSKRKVVLSGVATNAVRVVYRINGGPPKPARGLENWSVTVLLNEDKVIVTVEARNASGTSAKTVFRLSKKH